MLSTHNISVASWCEDKKHQHACGAAPALLVLNPSSLPFCCELHFVICCYVVLVELMLVSSAQQDALPL